jgi:hypothetical protein
MAEWLKAHAWKALLRLTPTGTHATRRFRNLPRDVKREYYLPKASASQDVTKNSENNRSPTNARPSLKKQTESTDAQNKGQAPADTDAKQTIVIRESTPVPKARKDWWDKFYVIFTGGLFIVGAVGVGCAVVTLGAVRTQATVMAEQRQVMLGQLRTMQEQIVEMSVQSGISQESVSVSRAAANAAQDGVVIAKDSAEAARSSVEMFISKERARLRIELKPLLLTPKYGSAYTVDFTVSIYGATPAFIVQTACVTYVLPLEAIESPQAGDAVIFPIFSLPPVIPASNPPQDRFAFLHLDEQNGSMLIAEIKAGRLFVGVRGFIKYRDVFDRNRETSFRYVWKYSSIYGLGGDYGNWEKCGTKEENQDT